MTSPSEKGSARNKRPSRNTVDSQMPTAYQKEKMKQESWAGHPLLSMESADKQMGKELCPGRSVGKKRKSPSNGRRNV